MRYLIQLISICILVGMLISCKKEDPEPATKDKVKGEWIWLKYIPPSFGGDTLTPASLGISKSLVIDETTFSEWINDTLKSSSTYEIRTGGNSHDSWEYILLASGDQYIIYGVNDTVLVFTNNFFDADIYERK